MNCFQNNTPANANKVNQNFKILADEVEQLKTAQPPENSGGGNVSYIRWGRVSCPSGASLIYKGYAASGHYSHKNGNLWYPTEGQCGALPCPPYVNNRELSCVVCTK